METWEDTGYDQQKDATSVGEAEHIEKAIARLADSTSRLEAHLRPVLRPSHPVSEVTEKLPVGSPLAELRFRLTDYINSLDRLIERIEV